MTLGVSQNQSQQKSFISIKIFSAKLLNFILDISGKIKSVILQKINSKMNLHVSNQCPPTLLSMLFGPPFVEIAPIDCALLPLWGAERKVEVK